MSSRGSIQHLHDATANRLPRDGRADLHQRDHGANGDGARGDLDRARPTTIIDDRTCRSSSASALTVVILGGAAHPAARHHRPSPRLREVEADRGALRRRRLQPATRRRDAQHRGRPPQPLAQHHAHPHRPRVRRSRANHRADAPLRRRRQPRAAHPARLRARLRRALPHGRAQNAEDVAQAMERIEKEAIRMGGLVEDLLELARLDEAKPLALAPVDLVPLARDAALDAMASSPDRDGHRRRRPIAALDGRPSSSEATLTPRLTDHARPARRRATRPDRLRRRDPRPAARSPRSVAPTREAVDPAPIVAAVSATIETRRHRARPRRTRSARCSPTSSATPCGSPRTDSPIEIAVGVDAAASARADRRHRPRRGHPAADPREDLPALLARRHLAHPRDRRQRPGARDRRRRSSPPTRARSTSLETPGGGATFRVALPLLTTARTPSARSRAPGMRTAVVGCAARSAVATPGCHDHRA